MTPSPDDAPFPGDPLPSPRHRRRGRIAFCILFPLLWLGHVLFTGRVLLPVPLLQQIAPWGTPRPDATWNPLMWDAMGFFYPIRLAAARAFQSGHLPLWNPFILCGTPLLADVQSAVLYPLNVLFWVLPVERAFGYSAYLHLVLAAWFTSYWLRREGVSRTGSLLGAVTFTVGGWSIAWLELPNFMATAVWLPLLLGLLAGAPRRSWARTSLYCAPVIGGMLLAGHLQIAFYCLLAAGIYALYHAASERSAVRIVPLLIGGALGVMLAAPQLLPARELSEISHRSTRATPEGYAAFLRAGQTPAGLTAFRVSHLTGIVAPGLYGNPSGGAYYGLGEYSEVTSYVGVLPLLLGVHGLFLLRRRRAVGALAVVAGAGLLLALGTPLNAPFYFGVPGFARFGTPGRALVMFVVAWSGLVGFGWDRVFSPSPPAPLPQGERGELFNKTEWSRTLLVSAVLVAVVAMAGVLLYPAPPVELLALTGGPALLRLTLLFVVAAALPGLFQRRISWLPGAALAFTLIDLWSFGAGYNLTGPAKALEPPAKFVVAVNNLTRDGVTSYLTDENDPNNSVYGRVVAVNSNWPLRTPPKAAVPPNLFIPMGGGRIPDVGGYEGAYLLSYKQQLNGWIGRDASPPTNGNLVMPPSLSAPMLRSLGVKAVLSARPLPPDRVQALGLKVADSGVGWTLYRVEAPTHRGEFYPSWPPPSGQPGSTLPIHSHGDLGFLSLLYGEPDPNQIFLPLTEQKAGVVLLRDANAPGWTVTIDGRPATPLPAQEAVGRLVRVTAKDRVVVWEYRPASLALGWKVMMGALFGMLSLFLISRRPAHHLSEPPPSPTE